MKDRKKTINMVNEGGGGESHNTINFNRRETSKKREEKEFS